MTSTSQLIEDAIAASKRAVQFDTSGQQEAAASYFYKVAADLLEKAAQVDGTEKSSAWLEKANEYRKRAATLNDIDKSHQMRDVIVNVPKQQLERCYFLFQQGLDADEAGLPDTAVELYTQAVEVALKQKCEDAETQTKLKRLALQALERAEELKGKQPQPKMVAPSSATTSHSKPPLHRGSSAHLKISGTTESYTLEEKKVLLHSSRINNKEYVPFMDIDLSERFQYAIPFTDKDGYLKLSPKQKREFDRWIRPEDVCGEPCIILGAHPDYLSIKQTIVSDCSFVASLAVSALYERRFGKRLVTSIIYPRSRDKQPMYNPFGKYMIKLHVNGITRKVIIDDQFPFSRHGQILCSYSSNRNELWVSLLEKAYMKVMGGYDFPGSNSNIDLHALTGWIPERTAIRESDKDFNRDSLFSTLESRMQKGDVLVTVATGTFSDVEADRTGLVSTHAYAVMDVRTINGVRLLKLKNPWSHLRWRGNYSELDTRHWTPELRRALAYDPDSAAQFDNGVFWIDYDSICRFFDVFYLNWNPGLFNYTYCIHQEWAAGAGPVKDSYNIGSNPQFTLDVDANASGAVWILLTRHITDITDFRDNKEYITVLVYKGNGKRIYYPHDPPPYLDGVRINSPHYLCKVILTPNSSRRYTLVISQYEKTQTIYYTLRAYATCPFRLSKITNPYIYHKQVSDSWTERTAGGCGNHVQTYKINPRYRLHLDSSVNSNHLFIELRGPKQYEIGFAVTIVSVTDTGVTAPFHTEITRPYRSGFVVMEQENIPAGVLHIIPSTFMPGQQGPYILTVKSSANIQLTREQ
ncbi:small optic lobes [Carabus blaptoides fortunei]